jgi:hypothetical protein
MFLHWIAYILVSFGPTFTFSVILLKNKPQLVLIAISAAFFWLISALIGAVFWKILPLKDIHALTLAGLVLLAEIARYLLFKSYSILERKFSVTSTNIVIFPLSDLSSGLAAGIGFGAIQALIQYGAVLAQTLGAGALHSQYCPQLSLSLFYTWCALFVQIVQIGLMPIAFDAFRRKSLARICAVWAVHFASSLITLLNQIQGGCVASISSLAGIACISVLLAWKCIHAPDYRSKDRDAR